jgi:hypothetical protein
MTEAKTKDWDFLKIPDGMGRSCIVGGIILGKIARVLQSVGWNVIFVNGARCFDSDCDMLSYNVSLWSRLISPRS